MILIFSSFAYINVEISVLSVVHGLRKISKTFPLNLKRNDHGMVNVTFLLAKDIENGKMRKNTVSFLPEVVVGILDP